MILDQQIKLELGDEYEVINRRTLSFIKTILNRMPLAPVKMQIMSNEGGGGGLRRVALSHIIEKGDVDEGLDAFASYLNGEYSTSNNRSAVHHTKWERSSVEARGRFTAPDVVFDESASSADSSDALTHSAHSLNKFLKTNEELSFFTALGDCNNSIVEAAKAVGISLAEARRIYFRVKQRIRR